MHLKTDYAVGEIPHSEHPMPQAKRENWLCLNGKWRLKKIDPLQKILFDGEILVPFSPETFNSGVEAGFVLRPGEKLVYERNVTVEKALLLGKTLLHFGAVDSECKVFFNGVKVGAHKGGFTAFTVDISEQVKEGDNLLRVECRDEGTRNFGARGKQNDERGGIWYTPQSGIWQTVWLESMPVECIKGLKVTTNVEDMSVTVQVDKQGGEKEIAVFNDRKEILRQKFTDKATLKYDFVLWSPENPKLYDVVITNGAGDRLESYFGVRSFGKTVDEKGIARLTLNGKPYFFNGFLDQ